MDTDADRTLRAKRVLDSETGMAVVKNVMRTLAHANHDGTAEAKRAIALEAYNEMDDGAKEKFSFEDIAEALGI